LKQIKKHELILSKGKLSVGWNKCPGFNHISVKDVLNAGVIFILRKTVLEMKHATNVPGSIEHLNAGKPRRDA